MRILTLGVAGLAIILAWPAAAQMGGGGGGRHHKGDDAKADDKKPKVDEKAYQDALKRIPEPKEKYDPWAVTKQPKQ